MIKMDTEKLINNNKLKEKIETILEQRISNLTYESIIYVVSDDNTNMLEYDLSEIPMEKGFRENGGKELTKKFYYQIRHFIAEIHQEELKNIRENPKLKLINDIAVRMGPGSKLTDKQEAVEIVSEHLIEQYHFKTVHDKKGDDMYYYKDGIYIPNGESIILSECENLMGEFCNNHYTSETINKIKRKTQVNREELDNAPSNMICVQNGIIVVDKEIKFIEHNPQHHFITKLKTSYNKEAKCPITLKFLNEALYNEDKECFQRFVGYLLMRKNHLKKAFILEGLPDTGKSITLTKITNLLGVENTSGVSLQDVCGNRFSVANMYGMLANIVDELKFDGIKDINPFKAVTGGMYVTGERKGQMQFKFINYAKLIYACNEVPKVEKSDDAYYNRWIIFKYDNIKEREDLDPELSDKMSTEEEMSGFLNYALEGLLKLLEKYDFKYRWEMEQVKSYMRRSDSVVVRFSQDMLEEEKDKNKYITRNDLYEEYKTYCIRNSLEIIPPNTFVSEMHKHYPLAIEGRVGKKNDRVWRGIRIKLQEPSILSSPETPGEKFNWEDD